MVVFLKAEIVKEALCVHACLHVQQLLLPGISTVQTFFHLRNVVKGRRKETGSFSWYLSFFGVRLNLILLVFVSDPQKM